MDDGPIPADCYYGDHDWRCGGRCAGCGKRLRCQCGAFAKPSHEWWERHFAICPAVRGRVIAQRCEFCDDTGMTIFGVCGCGRYDVLAGVTAP
jgi:hypothetical protein